MLPLLLLGQLFLPFSNKKKPTKTKINNENQNQNQHKFVPCIKIKNQCTYCKCGDSDCKGLLIVYSPFSNVKVHLPNESCYDIEELVSGTLGEFVGGTYFAFDFNELGIIT